jgi:hypothetical protein
LKVHLRNVFAKHLLDGAGICWTQRAAAAAAAAEACQAASSKQQAASSKLQAAASTLIFGSYMGF